MNSPLYEHLERAARHHAPNPAVIENERVLTYGDLYQRSLRVAELVGNVLTEGNRRVAWILPNSIDYVVLYWGVLRAGGTTVEIRPAIGDLDLETQIRSSEVRLLVASPGLSDRVARLGMSLQGSILGAWMADGSTEQARRLAGQLTEVLHAAAGPAPGPPFKPAAGDLASIVFTSGTTGRVKGVCLTHENLAWITRAIATSLELAPGQAAERFAGNLGFQSSYGKSVLHLATLLGAPIIVSERMSSPDQLMQILAACHVTHLSTVPFSCNLLLRRSDFNVENLPALRRITVAGGALFPEALQEVCRRFPRRVVPMYGLTEASTRVTCMPPGITEEHPASCGKPLPGVEVAIRVADGGIESVGEVLVRGPNVMLEYFGDAQATRETLRDGWLHTGDLGSLDADGYLHIRGRSKEVIKSMGESVSAWQVEATIALLPGIREVAVQGFPDPLTGEAVHAFVVIDESATWRDVEIQSHCLAALGPAAVPTRVTFLPELPRTGSGKVRKFELPVDSAAVPSPQEALSTPLEDTLVALWKQVLGVAQVGLHDDFFDLGGDSLMAMQLIAHLTEVLGVSVPIVLVFEASTVHGLAAGLLALDAPPGQVLEAARLFNEVQRMPLPEVQALLRDNAAPPGGPR